MSPPVSLISAEPFLLPSCSFVQRATQTGFGPLAGLIVCHQAWEFTNNMLLGLMSLGYITLGARVEIFQLNTCLNWHHGAVRAGDV